MTVSGKDVLYDPNPCEWSDKRLLEFMVYRLGHARTDHKAELQELFAAGMSEIILCAAVLRNRSEQKKTK